MQNIESKYYLSWEEVFQRLAEIDESKNIVYGIPKGGMIASAFLQYAKITHDPAKATIILDDISDSGKTMDIYRSRYPDKLCYALIDRNMDEEDFIRFKDFWIIFPWERDHPGEQDDTIQQNITRQLQFIGEDITREGLIDTPRRVEKMYGEIFKGYRQKPEDILTTFDAAGYDEIILLKDVELYSMCEHHVLPFFGKAHVAYIPQDRIVGISKLARLVDLYSKRLQIQERIGEQVTSSIMSLLNAKGAACIIEATHMCMRMRGVEKQNSVMVTSSMKGIFLNNPAARQELLQLIK